MALTLAVKEATWIRLLLTEISLLDKKGQYAEIKVTQGNKRVEQIKTDAAKQEKEAPSRRENPLTSNAVAPNKNHENCPLLTPLSSSLLAFNIPAILILVKKDNEKRQ